MRITLLANEKSILRTLCYSDIFDYPLTRKEIWKYQISNNGDSTLNRMTKGLESLQDKNLITYKDGSHCLKGREEIIELRKERKVISKEKLQKAEKIAYLLSFIPTIELIGISGSLAMENVKITDDIDFFIISKRHTIWITRLLVLIFLELKRIRRSRKLKNTSNKICVNMFLDSCSLLLPIKMINLFTAHEIAQMKIIFIRNSMDNKFIQSNLWVRNYLSNSVTNLSKNVIKKNQNFVVSEPHSVVGFTFLHWFIFPIEKLARVIQLFFINRHKTKEYISDTLLAFHPEDKTQMVLDEYKKRLREYNIS